VSVRKRLAQLATLRTKEIDIEGERFTVRESSAAVFAEYFRMQKTDRNGAIAMLLREAIVVPEGEEALTDADAAALARSQRVAVPLIVAVMDVNGYGGGDSEKEPIPG
jgi:hypothetical protein